MLFCYYKSFVTISLLLLSLSLSPLSLLQGWPDAAGGTAVPERATRRGRCRRNVASSPRRRRRRHCRRDAPLVLLRRQQN